MIRDKTTNVEVLTSLGQDRLKMGIDEEGMIHVTSLLANMYKNPEKAVLREYSVNARDSHIEAGQDRPIEITLPCGPWELPTEKKGRFLRIKDYGVGLSVEEIAEVYSRYGKSTKDESNEFEGMMGIGGKSGLADPFNGFKITGIKDGQKAVVMVGYNDDGAPVMDLASVNETDEPNGVEIELATPKHHQFAQKAENLFRFWVDEGSVLVDGKEPEKLKPHIKISDTMWVCTNLKRHYVVMGNTPYPVDIDPKLSDGYHLVIWVPIGAVNITPSREELRYTEKTKSEITRLLAEYDQAIKTVVQQKVNEAKTKSDAMAVALQWRRAFATTADLGVAYRGQKVPMTFETPGDEVGAIVISRHGSEKLSRHDKNKSIGAAVAARSLLVHGWNVAKFTPMMKKKLIKYAMEKGLVQEDDTRDEEKDKIEYFVLTNKRLAHGWFPTSQRVDYEVIKAITITHTRGRDGVLRPKGSYDGWIAGVHTTGIEASTIDVSKPIFYHSKHAFSTGWHNRRRTAQYQHLQKLYPDAYFIELPDNRVNKFCRDFPTARRTWDAIREVHDQLVAKISKADLMALAIAEHDYGSTVSTLKKLDPKRIVDPEIRKAIRQVNKEVSPQGKATLSKLNDLGWRNSLSLPEWKAAPKLEKYPLARFERSMLDHTYIYMNACFAARQKGEII